MKTHDRTFAIDLRVQLVDTNLGPMYWATATCRDDSLVYGPPGQRKAGQEVQASGPTPEVAMQRAQEQLSHELSKDWE